MIDVTESAKRNMRVFFFLINTIYWLWLFIVPAGILGIVSVLLYLKSKDNLPFSIIITLVGIILGIALAEYIRKRYGLDNFFGSIHSTPDIDGVDPLENKKRNGIN